MNSHTNGHATATVGELCELVNGRAFKPTEWGTEGLPIIRIQNLNDESKEFNYFAGNYSPKHEVNDGDLLFSWSGTPGTSFGAFFWNRGRGVLNQHIFNVHIDAARVEKRYFRYALNDRLNVIIHHAHGGVGLQHITKGKLEAVEIPLPPLSEQKRIANILDKADAIRRKRKEAQQHASDLFTAAFIDRFGDPVTNPKNWEKVQLPLITKRITVGIVVKPASYYVDEGVPALRSLNVRVNRIEKENFVFFSEKDNEGPLSKTRVWKDDVLLVRSGQPGTAAVVPEDLNGVNAIDVLIVTPDLERVTSQYLCYLFNSPAGKRLVLGEERGQIQKHLNVSSLKKLEVPLPPIGEQREFNRFLAVTASMQSQLGNASVTVAALFNSLVQRAFKGEL